MPDRGYRSIQVNVLNNTSADLTLVGVQCTGTNNKWIQGETPKMNDELVQFGSTQWGVSTDDTIGQASGAVELTGLGKRPVQITFANSGTGDSCTAVGNEEMVATATKQTSGQSNHSIWSVYLCDA